MFEEHTKDAILAEMIDTVDKDETGAPVIDTREASVFHDAIIGPAIQHANFYTRMGNLADQLFLETSTEEFLDRNGRAHKMERNQATQARYRFVYEGDPPPTGERFFVDGVYFLIEPDTSGLLLLVAEQPGSEANTILPGTKATPLRNGLNLAKAEFGELVEPGTDTEKCVPYRTRIQEKIAGPAENGNTQHYKTWCESIDGVGQARMAPLFFGENTMLAVLVGADGKPAATPVVERVQEYIDPVVKGFEVEFDGQRYLAGDGEGWGVANIGCHFLALAARPRPVDISVDIEVKRAAEPDELKALLETALVKHFTDLALKSGWNDIVVVRLADIGAMLQAMDEIIDHYNLTINGQAQNLTLEKDEVAELGEVSFGVV